MIDKLNDIILDLPEVIRPLAKIYADVVGRVGKEMLGQWVEEGLFSNWRDAHSMMVLKMTTQEAVAQLELINAAIAELNGDNAEFMKAQRQAFVKLAVAGLSAL